MPVGGRKCQTGGRPTKMSRTSEHGYCKASLKRKSTFDLKSGVLPKRRVAAPHNLSTCVTSNETLGKTH